MLYFLKINVLDFIAEYGFDLRLQVDPRYGAKPHATLALPEVVRGLGEDKFWHLKASLPQGEVPWEIVDWVCFRVR